MAAETETAPQAPFSFRVDGLPVAFARTRISATGALFTPSKQRQAAAAIRFYAQDRMREERRALFEGPVALEIWAYFPVPSSWSMKKHALAVRGNILPAKRPDASNLAKLVEDALNGVVFRDDALIVDLNVRKLYSAAPGTFIKVTTIESASQRAEDDVRVSGGIGIPGR